MKLMVRALFALLLTRVAVYAEETEPKVTDLGPGRASIRKMSNVFSQIGLARSQYRFATRPEIAEELKLKEAQKQRIQTLAQELNLASVGRELDLHNAAFKNATPTEADRLIAELTKKVEAVREDSKEKLLAELTSRQKKRFKQLLFQKQVDEGDVAGALREAGVELEEKELAQLNVELESAHQEFLQKASILRRELMLDAVSSVVRASKIKELAGEPHWSPDSLRHALASRRASAPREKPMQINEPLRRREINPRRR